MQGEIKLDDAPKPRGRLIIAFSLKAIEHPYAVECFEYQGRIYRKITPLATWPDGGEWYMVTT